MLRKKSHLDLVTRSEEMPEIQIDINDVGTVGVVRDMPPHEIPPEAWTLAENVRFEDDSVVQLLGYTQIFGTPGTAPYFAQFVSAPLAPWWLYAGLASIWAYNGASHFNITRAAGAYNATSAAQWQGTNLGGIPILNDGVDPPQWWSGFTGGTLMQNLTNWPANFTCKVLRAFGPYLMAMNITDTGVLKPYDVRWSHPADPGSLPVTWDITDPTHDAGQVSLSDVDSGQIVDGLPLQGQFYVYKENSCWRFRDIGGQFIFDENPFLENTGLLAPRCLAITGDGQRHFWCAQDNLYVHDGNSAKPLLNRKTQRYLFNAIDVGNYSNSFVFVNGVRREGWFCYPSSGNVLPTRAMIVNYDTLAMTECDIDFQAAATGTISTSDPETWASVTGLWTDDTQPWVVSNRRKILLCKPTVTKFEQLDLGLTRDGTVFTGLVQRQSLGMVGRNRRTGDWIVDFETRKMCHRIWPKMSGSTVNIRLGGQNYPGGPITWSPLTPFNPASQQYCDVFAEGAALCIEVSGQNGWKLDGYKLDLMTTGRF
jgi:hypothetical protein